MSDHFLIIPSTCLPIGEQDLSPSVVSAEISSNL